MPLSYSYMLSILNTHIHSGASIFITNYSFYKSFWKIKQIQLSFNGYIFMKLYVNWLNNLKIDSCDT